MKYYEYKPGPGVLNLRSDYVFCAAYEHFLYCNAHYNSQLGDSDFRYILIS
jgi:hypothetical protein